MKNTITAILLVLLFGQNSLQAQDNFLPGGIVNLNGDSLHGLIDYRNWKMNPTTISFRKGDSSEVIQYNPTQIRSFHVSNETYVGGIFKVNNSPVKVEALSSTADFTHRMDTVFLQALIQGGKSLFYYKDNVDVDHFYINADTGYQELLYKKYIDYDEKTGTKNIRENKRYRAQLSLYLQDCKNIATKLSGVSYTLGDLKKVFQYYYECTGRTPAFEKKVDKFRSEFGITAGFTLSKLTFEGEGVPYLTDMDYPTSTDFTGGLFFNFVIPRTRDRNSIFVEAIYTSYYTTGIYDYYYDGDLFSRSDVELGFDYIKLNAMLRYKIPVKDFFIIANAGLSSGFLVSESNNLSVTYYQFADTATTIHPAVKEKRSYEQGFLAGLGAKYKKLSFETRFEWSNGMSKYNSTSSTVIRYYFLFGYTF